MHCYYYETDAEFIFCVENVENAAIENFIKHEGWTRTNNGFSMPYPSHMFNNPHDKERIGGNFTCLGQAFFESKL